MRIMMIVLSVLYAYISLYVLIWLMMVLTSTTIETIGQAPSPFHAPEAPALAVAARTALPFVCTLALILGIVLVRRRQLVLSEIVLLVPVGLYALIFALSPSLAGWVAWHYSSIFRGVLSLLG